jgi:hypothetical protein
VVAIEYAAALLIGRYVGFHYTIPFASYAIAATVVIVLAFAAFIAWQLFKARKGDVPADFQRFISFAVGIMLIALQMAVLNWTKIMLPIVAGFWADPYIASADRVIFGTDAWRLLHTLNGPTIDRAYVTWGPIHLTMLAIILCLRESTKKVQALLSYFLILFTGSIGQYALPSAGPLFHQPIPLEPWVAEAKAYLWQDYLRAGGSIGTGISAMPSIHVAIALWLALVVRSYVPKLWPIGFGYFALIAVGSVALGWHYVSDGLVAIAGTLLVWRAAGAGSWITWNNQLFGPDQIRRISGGAGAENPSGRISQT